MTEVRDLRADECRGESESEGVAPRVQFVEGTATRGRDRGEMQRPPEGAREPVAQRRRRVEPDVDVDVAERSPFHLEHPVRREVPQAAVQATKCIAERGGLEMDGDVDFGLHGEERCQPSRPYRMAWEPLQRVAAEHEISITGVLAMLGPAHRRIAV